MHTKYEPVPVLAQTSTVAYRLPRLLSCSPGVLIPLRIVIPWLSLEELPGSISWALGSIRQGTPNFFQGHSSHPRLARDFSCAVRFSVLGIWTAHMYFPPVHKAMDFILAFIHIYCICLSPTLLSCSRFLSYCPFISSYIGSFHITSLPQTCTATIPRIPPYSADERKCGKCFWVCLILLGMMVSSSTHFPS